MPTLADDGGVGAQQMKTLADKGGKSLANTDITDKNAETYLNISRTLAKFVFF